MVSTKSKTITKQKMTSSLIELCFPILIEDCDEGIEDDDEESPRKSALQLLDVISISLSSADVLPGIDSFIHKFVEQTVHGRVQCVDQLLFIPPATSPWLVRNRLWIDQSYFTVRWKGSKWWFELSTGSLISIVSLVWRMFWFADWRKSYAQDGFQFFIFLATHELKFRLV